MDITDDLIIPVLPQRILDEKLERLLLGICRHRAPCAQHLVDQLRLEILGFLRIIQDSVKVRIPVIERREQESLVRRFHDPVADPVLHPVILRIVGQPRLGKRHRADTAHQIFIHIIRRVVHFQIVRCLSRDIIHGMDQDDIIISLIYVILNDFVIKFLQKHVVFQLTVL